MLLYPPLKFDENEIFIIILLVFTYILLFAIPRHLNRLEILLIWTLNVYLVFTADMSLAVPPADLYDTMDIPEHEIFDFIIFFFGYFPIAYFAMNYFKARTFSFKQIILFIVVCALLTTMLEWVAVKLNVFTFKGWKSYLSFLIYLVVYSLNVLLFLYIKRKVPKKALWARYK